MTAARVEVERAVYRVRSYARGFGQGIRIEISGQMAKKSKQANGLSVSPTSTFIGIGRFVRRQLESRCSKTSAQSKLKRRKPCMTD